MTSWPTWTSRSSPAPTDGRPVANTQRTAAPALLVGSHCRFACGRGSDGPTPRFCWSSSRPKRSSITSASMADRKSREALGADQRRLPDRLVIRASQRREVDRCCGASAATVRHQGHTTGWRSAGIDVRSLNSESAAQAAPGGAVPWMFISQVGERLRGAACPRVLRRCSARRAPLAGV
jgi:hypothetical protein